MDPASFISQARELYVDQFRAFVEQQKPFFPNGAPERKFVLSEPTDLYRQMYCVDFVTDEGSPEPLELEPAQILDFKPITGSYGNAALRIDHLRWEELVIYHDAPTSPERLPGWFEYWFDPENRRHDPSTDVLAIIHYLMDEPGKVSADMGTAPGDAFWQLMELIETAGARNIRITASRDEAAAATG